MSKTKVMKLDILQKRSLLFGLASSCPLGRALKSCEPCHKQDYCCLKGLITAKYEDRILLLNNLEEKAVDDILEEHFKGII